MDQRQEFASMLKTTAAELRVAAQAALNISHFQGTLPDYDFTARELPADLAGFVAAAGHRNDALCQQLDQLLEQAAAGRPLDDELLASTLVGLLAQANMFGSMARALIVRPVH